MNYCGSAEGLTITRQRPLRELQAHGCEEDWQELLRDLGDHQTYDAQAVLEWLGY